MKDFELVLEESLGDLAAGATTPDEVLRRYPEHADRLSPLLRTAERLERGRAILPAPAFRARARAQLLRHIDAHPRRRAVPFRLRLSFALAALMIAMLTTGTAFAQSAMPGDVLYGWKVASEQVWRAVRADQVGVDLALSDRRMQELLAAAGDSELVARALQAYQESLDRLASESNENDRARVLPVVQSQHKTLQEAGLPVPPLPDFFPRELEKEKDDKAPNPRKP